MPVDRGLAYDLAAELGRVYADASHTLMVQLARRLAAGIDASDWYTRQLAAAGDIRTLALRLIARLDSDLHGRVEQAIVRAYVRGGTAALDELAQIAGMPAGTTAAARAAAPGIDAVNLLVWATIAQLSGTHTQILRWSLDTYRAVIAAAAPAVLLGHMTRREAAQRAWQKFVDGGITGFVDKSGRRWELASYTEMASRTAVTQAAVQGHIDQLGERGFDLVAVSGSPGSCPVCEPWEGAILTRGESRPGVVNVEHATRDGVMVPVRVAGSVADAVAAGLLHPNCRHRLMAYLPGITRPARTIEGNAQHYADRDRLRALERAVRKWKTRQATALDPGARRAAALRVRAAQAAVRDHVAATGLIRQPYREQIGRAR